MTKCFGTKSQIAILTLTVASACGKIKRQDWMWIQNSPQKDKLLRRLSTADGLTPMSLFFPTEIWAQLYNPIHSKVQAFISWLQNSRVVLSLNIVVPVLLCWCLSDNLDSRARVYNDHSVTLFALSNSQFKLYLVGWVQLFFSFFILWMYLLFNDQLNVLTSYLPEALWKFILSLFICAFLTECSHFL